MAGGPRLLYHWRPPPRRRPGGKQGMLGRFALAAAVALALVSTSEAKTLVYCSGGAPETLNPQLSQSGTAIDAAHPLYDQLVQFDYGWTNLAPGLAERWEVNQ